MAPVFEVIVELREGVTYIKGCSSQMMTADKPKHILPKARFTESVLAHIVVSKMDDRQPYYYLEKQFEQCSGITLSRQTIGRSTIECTEPLQVLNQPGRKATTTLMATVCVMDHLIYQ